MVKKHRSKTNTDVMQDITPHYETGKYYKKNPKVEEEYKKLVKMIEEQRKEEEISQRLNDTK